MADFDRAAERGDSEVAGDSHGFAGLPADDGEEKRVRFTGFCVDPGGEILEGLKRSGGEIGPVSRIGSLRVGFEKIACM